jgi:hypothetical protein
MVLTTNELYDKLELKNQEKVLLRSLKDYYKNNICNLLILIEIINSDNKISKRTIEYFVTQYSIKNNINYTLNENNNNIIFNVYNSYKNQLKAYKKKYFDPFGRGDRIPFILDDYCIITTIGQLNFYKWFFSKKIYDYCYSNYNIIQVSLLSIKKKPKKLKNNINKNIKYDYCSNINNNGHIIVSYSL